jgi:hypothetical protein
MLVSRDKLRANPALSGWWTHVILLDSPRMIVGFCGYTGPPNANGEVEIAYGVAPAYWNWGIATIAAAELIRRAFVDNRTRVICAHTLPEHNASTRVLEKLGMRFAGLDNDPDEGTVWRWELKRGEGFMAGAVRRRPHNPQPITYSAIAAISSQAPYVPNRTNMGVAKGGRPWCSL